MSQQFFAFFIVVIISLIIFVIIEIAVPICRFMITADAAIKLYGFLKEFLITDFSIDENIEVSYGKYKLAFSNTNEAILEIEKIVHEALECYNKLGWIAVVGKDTFKAEKDELIHIYSKIRMLRWEKQGV